MWVIYGAFMLEREAVWGFSWEKQTANTSWPFTSRYTGNPEGVFSAGPRLRLEVEGWRKQGALCPMGGRR